MKGQLVEQKKELDRIKKILLTNLTNQVQLLLDFKSRAMEDKDKLLLKERIEKVNSEMRKVNQILDLQEIKASYGEDMIAPLDVTLKVKQGNAKNEIKMDYANCSK